MKRALLLNAVNPKIGGVLVRGKKGTAKSTAVRSLAGLLPSVTVVQGCPYNCSPEERQGLCTRCDPQAGEVQPVVRQIPIIDLPVGATEDRLVGSLDIEEAIKTGNRVFEPGLIAATHRGILYIDEVNLLNDHLVDILLDAAAMGRNYVEREGISVTHRSEFILVGTMNPEEGDLRPQLLDRFGLAVEVEGRFTPEERQEVVKRRIAYEADSQGFMAEWSQAEVEERERVLRSQKLLPQVIVSDDILTLITAICAEYDVDGMRGDIVMYKTAATIAAYEDRTEVNAEDVREAANLALLHRQRRQPFQQPNLATEQLDSMVDDFQGQDRQRESQDSSQNDSQGEGDSEPSDLSPPDLNSAEPDNEADNSNPGSLGQEEQFEVGDPYSVRPLNLKPPDQRSRRASGRRNVTITDSSAGRYVGSRMPEGKASGLALDATLRAAAPHQLGRRAASESQNVVLIEAQDIRDKVRESKSGSMVLFVVDASGSMGAQRRMVAVKGAVMSLLLDAYQRRDRVGMISFRGTSASLMLPPTNSVDLARVHLADMPTGGRTPLSAGLFKALEVIETERVKDRNVLPLLVLLSDGRGNVALGLDSPLDEAYAAAGIIGDDKIPSVVVDTESGYIRLGMVQSVAEAMDAQYLKLEDLRAESLADAVRQKMPIVGEAPPHIN
ncbi:MAG: magnesium chelatase [Chloroflexi bacterium]|nr:magnesium chelatase [Chloroflexota bacterium]MDP6497772.1 magnesium chelatase subunit D family protein [Dehalococcoidia bacterium]MQG55303.1 VWA domain-containing protein [SAR202 cluster bacterium]|tara:strand:+ start:154919 stop:156922 length:2004 start_codon:yes stop_codon:yes gene_type:complete